MISQLEMKFEGFHKTTPQLSGRVETETFFRGNDTGEALVLDARSRLCPAQQVENRLKSLLGDAAVPLSHLRTNRLCAGR
jgi:hypothetical protein